MFTKKTILQKTAQFGIATLLSRFLGIAREILQVKYLGVSNLSDAFITALYIPSSLRKIFAEGAMSAVLVPTLTKKVKETGQDSISSFMSLSVIAFEGIVLGLTILGMIFAPTVIWVTAPGFNSEQLKFGATFLRVLFPFILFISTSALLASALQTIGHFFITAFAPVLLNIFNIIALVTCMYFNFPVIYLCYGIVSASAFLTMIHIYLYFIYNFKFTHIAADDFLVFLKMMKNFFWSFLAKGANELASYIDRPFASYLNPGSITILYYANRFLQIPIGVIVVPFSTILLAHFSQFKRTHIKRLSFQLFEAVKLIVWLLLPIAIGMFFTANRIFSTFFLSDKFNQVQVDQAGFTLQAFLLGLIFFGIKILLEQIFYACHVTWIPGVLTLIASCINIFFNFLFITHFKVVGLALATSFATTIQVILLYFCLYYRFGIGIPYQKIMLFIRNYSIQIVAIGMPHLFFYFFVNMSIKVYLSAYSYFFTMSYGFWALILPIGVSFMTWLYISRKKFNVNLYYLNR